MTVIRAYESAEAVGAGSGETPVKPDAGRKVPVRELIDDRVLDVLLEQSIDEAGRLRPTGGGRCSGSWCGRCWSARWRPS